MTLTNRYSLIVAACATSLALPLGASAQEAIDEIIVTVQKREQVLSDVPLAVQAFSEADIEAAGLRSLNDVVNFIPGASVGRTTNAATPVYQIRGVSSYFGESTVGYYLDDATFSIPNRNFAPVGRTFDVERVEVARGPQGTLYGLGAMGGTVRFITADPDLTDVVVRGDVGYSDTDGGEPNYYGDLAVSAPIIEDVLAVRLTGSYELRGGYATSPTFPGQESEDELQNYRAKLLYQPLDEMTVKLMYQHDKVEDDMGKQLKSLDPPSYAPVQGALYQPHNTSEYDMYNAYLSYDFGSLLLESSSGYIDRDASGKVPLNVPGNTVPNLTIGGGSESLSSELRLVSQFEGPLQFVTGVIYLDAENTEIVTLRTPSPPLPAEFRLRDATVEYTSKSWAAFGEVSYELLDGRLIPLLGVRYFDDEREFTDTNRKLGPAPGPPVAVPPFSVYHDEQDFDSVNPRFNLAYKLTDDDLVYLNIAKGFRSGTFNTQDAQSFPGAESSVDEDSLWSYEVGSKLALMDGSLMLETAVYYFDWTDQQLNFSSNATQIQYILNAGDTTGLGLDYGVVWRTPLEGLRVRIAGNINETEFDKIDDDVQPFLSGQVPGFAPTSVIEGEQVANVPKHTETLELSYTLPVDSAGADLSLVGIYTNIAKQGDPGQTVKGDSQQLAGLRAGLQWEHWSATLFGTNLLNEDEAIQISGSGIMQAYPRTIGIEVGFEY